MTSGVYFIECDGYVKIGASTDVEARLRSHRSTMPPTATVLGWVECDNPFDLEKMAHMEHEFHRHGRTEWFRSSAYLLGWIEHQLGRGEITEWCLYKGSQYFDEMWPT